MDNKLEVIKSLEEKLMGHSNIDTTMEYVYTSDLRVSSSYRQYIA